MILAATAAMRRENCKAQATRLLAGCIIMQITMLLAHAPAHAAIYKCVSADGSTTYNDAPCAADQSAHQLSKSARQIDVLDCRIARNFAVDAVARMRQDDTATQVFEAYGGARKMSEGARQLINYVYTFSTKRNTSAQRIVERAMQRCQAGLINSKLDKCQTFPSEFITRLGGCVDARRSEQTFLIREVNGDDIVKNSVDNKNVSDSSEPVLNAATPDTTPNTEPATNPVTNPITSPTSLPAPPSDIEGDEGTNVNLPNAAEQVLDPPTELEP